VSATTFEAAALPLELRREMCLELLAEFGVTSYHERVRDCELNIRCPQEIHGQPERHPSASLNYDKLVFKCLACGSQGGLLWFIAMCRGTPTTQVRDWLLSRTGMGPDFDLEAVHRLLDAVANPQARERTPIPRFSPRMLDPWRLVHPYLTDPPPSGRGIPLQNVLDAEVCYAERYPLGKGADGEPLYGRMYGERVVIPEFWGGHLVGWQSRRLYDDGTPKYLSSPDFPSARTVYNYARDRRTAVVVESAASVLRHQHHLPMEGTWGADVTDAQVRLLSRHDRVVLWLDNDTAGWKAVGGWSRPVAGRREEEWVPGLIERLERYSEVLVVDSPWAADPADLDEQTAEGLVADAVPGAVWRRPEALRCWLCKDEHDGRCP
jgi:hypothetical protein